MIIFIVGLRRSGTTAFWETLKQDKRFCCFDDPFNPKLIELPLEHQKNVRKEFIDIVRKDNINFWNSFSPIYPVQELEKDLKPEQIKYLKYLIKSEDNVIIDFTRCNFKLKDLKTEFPEAYLIHLHRSPAAFVTSHLLPSYSSIVGKIYNTRNRKAFFVKISGFNNWKYEELIGDLKHGPLISKCSEELDKYRFREINMPAFCKLSLFWKLNFDYVESVGKELFGNKYMSVKFEEFCLNPNKIIALIYNTIELNNPIIDTSNIHPPEIPYKIIDKRWQCAIKLISLNKKEFFRENYIRKANEYSS